ncbi:NTPase [Persephonella sp.]
MKIVLTGKPGIGKTTVIKKVMNFLGEQAVGFYTEDYRDKTGKRKGFKIITSDGNEEILADKSIKSKYRVGSYGVNLEGFEKIVIPILEKVLKDRERILIIDEIGKMELFSEKFVRLIKKIFDDKYRTIVATVPVKDVHPVVGWIKKLPDAVLIEVIYENRDKLSGKIVELLSQSSSQRFDRS